MDELEEQTFLGKIVTQQIRMSTQSKNIAELTIHYNFN